MLKLVRHGDGIRRTGYYAEVAHSTKLQVVYKCVETLFLLAVFLQFLFGNDLDGAVGAGDLAGLASRTAVLVLIIMWFRWTFPRLRVDQLLTLEWKYLLPISMFNIILVTIMAIMGWHF